MAKLYDVYFAKAKSRPAVVFPNVIVTENSAIDVTPLRKRGRPAKPNKLTSAERQKMYRARKKANA